MPAKQKKHFHTLSIAKLLNLRPQNSALVVLPPSQFRPFSSSSSSSPSSSSDSRVQTAPSATTAAPAAPAAKKPRKQQATVAAVKATAATAIPDVPASISFPKEEESVLAFWKEIDAFETSVKLSEGRPPFSFYDGPPFATGLPHYGHLLAGTIKDVVTRFAHVNGHYVERRFGWDTHGVPIEFEIDKKLKIKSPADVAEIGIAKYNEECRSIVMTYASEWETTVKRMGRWIDFKNDYKTLETPFMESVWWVFKRLFDEGHVYRGFKIMPYSMSLCTPLSNFEAGQNYKDVNDPAVVVSFPLQSDPSVSLLAWTTTPWTLPSNLALCVNPDFEYVKIKDGETGAIWILLEKCLGILYKDVKKAKFTVIEKIKGSSLKGLKYTPIFDFYADDADSPIQKDIKAKGRLIRQTQYNHSYPHCYRSDTPLIYRAVPSWFVRVTPIVDRLLKNNDQTYWVPDFIGEKRFRNWLASAHDWGISRNRYWGTPIPLWASEDFEEIVVIGSVDELKKLTGNNDITDLHRHNIDHLTIPSKKGKGVLRRVPEVFDCWFESGSMPYAQQHYPFENKQKFESTFPADFIAEGIDQTRGWFYSLMILSTLLFDKPAWKNVIVNGFVLASDGKKMSKRLKNYPDPVEVIDKYGADVLRLYLVTSPAVRAENLRFREEGVKEIISQVMLPWYNAYRFFFAQLQLLKKEHNFDFVYNPSLDLTKDQNVMDRWILSSTQSLILFVKQEMDAYRLYTVTPRLLKLIDTLTNWYVRFNRKRLKGENGIADAERAMNVLFEVLFTLCRLMTSFTPFITESMFQNLRKFLPPSDEDTRSVHFLLYPEAKHEYFDDAVERAVGRMQTVIELARFIREQQTLSLKTPCRELIIISPDLQYHEDIKALESYIQEEMNVHKVTVTSEEAENGVLYKLTADPKALGTKFKKDATKIRNALPNVSTAEILGFIDSGVLHVEGFELTTEEIQVTRYMDESRKGFHANFTNDVLVILDTTLDSNLIQEGLARELVNRVQRLRKKAGLQPVDEVLYYYELLVDPDEQLAKMIPARQETLLKYLKQDVEQVSRKKQDAVVLFEEEQEVISIVLSHFRLTLVLFCFINDSKFMLQLVQK
eukprot:jgi/Hompol1/4655/HPOL_001518-RA